MASKIVLYTFEQNGNIISSARTVPTYTPPTTDQLQLLINSANVFTPHTNRAGACNADWQRPFPVVKLQ